MLFFIGYIEFFNFYEFNYLTMLKLRKLFLLVCIAPISIVLQGQIIADHNVVDEYENIPNQYIEKVKEMWFVLGGESHSRAYRRGLESLEALDATFQVNATEAGNPEAYTDMHLRVSSAMWGDYDTPTGWEYWIGEEDWWTSQDAIDQVKTGLSYCSAISNPISVIGFGWCWDASWGAASSGTDPVTGNHWYGELVNSPGGVQQWGLSADDFDATGNSLCMDSYLTATQEYISYCESNYIPTQVIFTTGPVDNPGFSNEAMYQQHLKWEYIREYVRSDANRILFDYADILCYDDDGSMTASSWNGNEFPVITPTNLGDETIGHIGEAGTIRIAKAVWWMLARIAGWDGIPTGHGKGLIGEDKTIVYRAGDKICVEIEGTMSLQKIKVLNINGKQEFQTFLKSNKCYINTDGLAAGMYFIVVENSSGSKVSKVVVN